MSAKVLQKCIKALNEKEPDISYIKGMLETLLEMTGAPYLEGTSGEIITPPNINVQVNDKVDEEIVPEFAKPGRIGKIG